MHPPGHTHVSHGLTRELSSPAEFEKAKELATINRRLIPKKTSPNFHQDEPLVPGRKRRYELVALGGTFDVFHIGHQLLLSTAFRVGERVLIGVTGNMYLRKNPKKHPVQPYRTRVKALRRFLKKKGWSARARIVQLDDHYGPASRLRHLQALVITSDTAMSARNLNMLRREKGLPTLKIHKISLSRAMDGRPVSSTRIRRREIDGNGRVLTR